jgi:GNAT superfamily N-acetyltransferase
MSEVESKITIDEIRGADADRQFAALEDRSFGVLAPDHYLDDFPIWDSNHSTAVGTVFRIGAFEGTKLVAAAGVRLAEMKYPKGPVTVALIGAVATDSDYRGRGLATQLVSTTVQWAGERGAALAMLWGSEHQLYGKIGFAPCGTQASLPLSSLMIGRPGEKEPEISKGWTQGLLGALKSRPSGIQIRDIDRGWLSAQKNVQWFWTGDPLQVTAYAAIGRGIDLPHFVHEWGGERTALLSILRRIAAMDGEAKLLGSPALFAKYGFQYDSVSEERLGLARVIDPKALFQAVHGDAVFTSVFSNSQWKIGLTPAHGKTVVDSLAPLEISRLFFGPIPTSLKKPWSDYFPLPLWFWGLDAV